jgi:hypothetical protein
MMRMWPRPRRPSRTIWVSLNSPFFSPSTCVRFISIGTGMLHPKTTIEQTNASKPTRAYKKSEKSKKSNLKTRFFFFFFLRIVCFCTFSPPSRATCRNGRGGLSAPLNWRRPRVLRAPFSAGNRRGIGARRWRPTLSKGSTLRQCLLFVLFVTPLFIIDPGS